MARPYRLQAENCLYHITSRGDDRKNIYINSYDYEKFLEYEKTEGSPIEMIVKGKKHPCSKVTPHFKLK